MVIGDIDVWEKMTLDESLTLNFSELPMPIFEHPGEGRVQTSESASHRVRVEQIVLGRYVLEK